MVAQDFANYFLAIAGATAALIGLLFVAVSVAPESTVRTRAPVERKAIASSAYTALLNPFVISFGALIPQPQQSLGLVEVAMAGLGVLDTLFVGRQLAWHPRSRLNAMRRFVLFAGSLTLYVSEMIDGWRLARSGVQPGVIFPLTYLLLAICVIGMGRAWQLLGARKTGLGSWLSILNDDVDGSAGESPGQDRPAQ
jgi:hypothetical protein